MINQQNNSSISPRKQFTPADTMGQVLQYNPSVNNNRNASPHRPNDQPKTSFFHIQDDVQHVVNPLPKVDTSKHNYNFNNQRIIMNDKQRKQVDLLGNQSQQITINEILSKSQEKLPQQLINTSVEWTNVHYGKTKTSVNEKADFTNDYAKLKKQESLQQQYIDGTKHQPLPKAIENEMNIDSKKQNHQFSDVFGQELGLKDRKWLRPQRSLSPQMKWTTYDSIRNVKDIGDMAIKESKLRSANQEKDNYKKNHPVTQPFFDCKITYEKIKGQYKDQFNNYKTSNMKFGQEKRIEASNSGSKKQYSGIYSWKNNYK